MGLQLLDFVGLAANQALPVLKVAVQVVLGRVFYEDQCHVVGRQAVQESCLRLRAPAVLGLRLQLQVCVHDQGRGFLCARALLGGEVVGLARGLEVAVLHDLFKRYGAMLSVLGVGDELGQGRLGTEEQCLGKSSGDALDLDCLILLDLLLPVSRRQLLRLGRGRGRGRRGSSRRRGGFGGVSFATLLPHVPEAGSCHWEFLLGHFQNRPVVQVHRFAERRDDCFIKFLARLSELCEYSGGRHPDVRDVLPEAVGCARGREQRLQLRVHGSGGAGQGQTKRAAGIKSASEKLHSRGGNFLKRCEAAFSYGAVFEVALFSLRKSWRYRSIHPRTDPALALPWQSRLRRSPENTSGTVL